MTGLKGSAKRRRRYSKKYDDQVLSMFEMGLSATRISNSLDVPIGSVYKTIRSKFPEWDGRKILPTKEIVSAYKKGDTCASLADKYGVTHNTIKSRLIEAGVEIRDTGEAQRVHFFNDRYFETIDSADKAYWLGYLFADGNVSSRMNDVSIAIKSSDVAHLEKFAKSLDYSGPGAVLECAGQGFSGDYKYNKIAFRSEQMAQDLVSHGCIPNKSFDLGPPTGLPREYEIDFIRGVCDGDGYVSKAGTPSVEIVGAYALLEWIASRIEVMSPIRPHKNIWRIRCCAQNARDVMDMLYNTEGVSMDRKREAAANNVGF